jgi:hypothetical protein
LKVWVCAGTATLGSESAIDTGMTDDKREDSQGKLVVMDFVEPCFGSWRGVTVHNICHSSSIGCRTVQTRHNNNRPNVPQQMRDPTRISSALQKGRVLQHFWAIKKK